MKNNFKNIIASKFNSDILHLISELNICAQKTSVRLYFVGGLVRDLIMGSDISDIDILVEGSAIDFCSDCDICEILSIHKDFGTVKARVGGYDIDFASTRREHYPQSGCLPVVTEIGVPLEIDVKRRDFTINAIALSLSDFELVDYYNGVSDIQNKKLKILHEDSFIDDPTRILRGLDFELRFGFEFDNFTKTALKSYLADAQNLRDGLSISRVELTLDKLLQQGEPAYTSILSKSYYKIFKDAVSKILYSTIEDASKIFGVSASKLAKFALLNNLLEPYIDTSSDYNLYLSLKKYSDFELATFYIFGFHNDLLLKYFNSLKDISLNLSGADLISLGFEQGKLIGDVLDNLLRYRINSKIQLTKDEEISYILENFKK
ncbi:CCA tRNA nucleotidyltransferase [bacterium]|nr:CCA tRNA nucleotidyltransferase [bacterium]